MDSDQPLHPRSLIRIDAVRYQFLYLFLGLASDSMDPDQTAWMRRLVWIHAGCKPIMLVLSWHSSFILSITISCHHPLLDTDLLWQVFCQIIYFKDKFLSVNIVQYRLYAQLVIHFYPAEIRNDYPHSH
jgi:hypothetical protein